MSKKTMALRVEHEDLNQFQKVCKEDFDRDPNDVLRELIKAFSEHRVKITPTNEQKKERSTLYHE